ncbi:acyl-CoA synthetase (AMP-forming)/AMP-acid ligase II [Streptomyces sp. SLBN-118]|uniref:fatty acid CoA ligase family protein n=1 Tax=Streptomyces sp. SLBN-118 TaxID=2768454 RepID=UPI0011506D22|nr:fatty acid CoA ligase family protein [Streptomyces sp. SLBN-118]TQK50222.1 acyl-CoA synthetase (AMP-forming)/AMP-acid ligase II [Streptomyces sp. SLBN-118]
MPGTTTALRQDAFLAELLAWHAVRTPDKPAVIHPDGDRMESAGRPAYASVSYGELATRVNACAAALEAHGIRRGTRTALLVTPGVDLLTLVFALMHVGAVPVVVDPGMGLGRMLDCIHRVGVQAFIGVPSAHILRRLRPRAFAGVRSLIKVGRGNGTALEELTALGASLPQSPPLESGPEDLALIGYTTGSTGPAKPVEITVGMLLGMAYGVEEGHFTTDMTSTLVTLPLMGVFDLAAGRTAVVPKMNMGRVGAADPALLTDAIQRFHVNAMFASPALLGPLSAHLAQSRARVPSLRLIVSGGAPVSPELMAALRAVLPDEARVFSTYGSTEALPMALLESREARAWPADGPAAGLGVCVGRPAPGTSVRVIGISDGPVPRWIPGLGVATGEMGEIVVSGRAVSPRYFQSPRADSEHKIQDGERRWHRTGDVGWIDGEGRIWFCGRKSHRVRASDGDLHTVRCEGVFNTHPEVKRTALVGFGPPDEQRPVLCVELAPGADSRQWPRIEGELRELGANNPVTKAISDFLPHPAFPVDIRHNAKIRRELLAGWAEDRLTGSRRPTAADRALRTVPLLGWAYLAAWPLLPWDHGALTTLWWLDAFLSVVVHAAQIPSALSAEQELATGRKPWATAALTMLFGATWWRTGHRKTKGASR